VAIVHLLFLKSIKEVFRVLGALHSPKTIPAMVHYQTFRIIIWQSFIKSVPPIWHWEHADKLCGFDPWEPSSLPRVPIVILLNINVNRIPLIYSIFILQIHWIDQLYQTFSQHIKLNSTVVFNIFSTHDVIKSSDCKEI